MNLVKNTKGWKIKSGTGFVDFEGVSQQGKKQLHQLKFTDNSAIEISAKHVFFTPDGREIRTYELIPGVELLGVENKTVASIKPTTIEQTYDVIGSSDSMYFSNGLLSHNCHFLSSEALLIDTMVLQQMTINIQNIKPIKKVKQIKFWEEFKPQGTYLVGVDPATGSGNDFTVIEVFEFPSLRQVAEYRTNNMSPTDVYVTLKNLLLQLERLDTTVYFTIENNGVGQGLISLFMNDEAPPENCEFVSEEKKDGMITTSRTKMRACVNLKELIEKRNITIRSHILLSELKAFTRHKSAYAAQRGSTDDCVSSVLLIARLVEEIASYDQSAFDKLYAKQQDSWSESDWDGYEEGYDDNDEGLPMVF